MGARARRESVARGFLADPSPGSESFRVAARNRRPSLVRDFFPTENFGRRALRKRSVDRKLLRKRSGNGKALRKCSGRFLRVPRSLTGAVMNSSYPAALDTRGAGNAQERRRWRRKRLSIRVRGAAAASRSAAGTACRDGGPDAREQRKAKRRPAWAEGLRLMRGVLT